MPDFSSTGHVSFTRQLQLCCIIYTIYLLFTQTVSFVKTPCKFKMTKEQEDFFMDALLEKY